MKRYDINFEIMTTRICPKCGENNVENCEIDCDDLFSCGKCHSRFRYNYDREDIGDGDRCFEFLPK